METYQRIRNMEIFKDGNILGERQLKPGEVTVLPADVVQRCIQSGATFEIMETLVKNPLRAMPTEGVSNIAVEDSPILKELEGRRPVSVEPERQKLYKEIVTETFDMGKGPIGKTVASVEESQPAKRKAGRPRKNG